MIFVHLIIVFYFDETFYAQCVVCDRIACLRRFGAIAESCDANVHALRSGACTYMLHYKYLIVQMYMQCRCGDEVLNEIQNSYFLEIVKEMRIEYYEGNNDILLL